MQPLNQLFKSLAFFIFVLSLCIACGDHSKPEVSDPNATPIINLTSGPYIVTVDKDLIVGIETKYAKKEPVYTAVPSPIGIAIVNQVLPGQIYITGLKPGTTSFTITDSANPKAASRTISVTVKEAPKLTVKPATLSGRAGQVLLLEISTLNQDATPQYTIIIQDTGIARITDPVNNPFLIDLIKTGETNIVINDIINGVSQTFTLTVTN